MVYATEGEFSIGVVSAAPSYGGKIDSERLRTLVM